MVFRKSRFGWVRFHCLISIISGPKFTEYFTQRGRNRGTKPLSPILNIFIRSGDIRSRTLTSSEIGPNVVCFCPLNFLGVPPPQKKLDGHYKTRSNADQRAKFRADRPTHLEDLMIEAIFF